MKKLLFIPILFFSTISYAQFFQAYKIIYDTTTQTVSWIYGGSFQWGASTTTGTAFLLSTGSFKTNEIIGLRFYGDGSNITNISTSTAYNALILKINTTYYSLITNINSSWTVTMSSFNLVDQNKADRVTVAISTNNILTLIAASTSGVQGMYDTITAVAISTGIIAGMEGGQEGDILVYNGGAWYRLAAGSVGEALTMGASTPTWSTASATDVNCRKSTHTLEILDEGTDAATGDSFHWYGSSPAWGTDTGGGGGSATVLESSVTISAGDMIVNTYQITGANYIYSSLEKTHRGIISTATIISDIQFGDGFDGRADYCYYNLKKAGSTLVIDAVTVDTSAIISGTHFFECWASTDTENNVYIIAESTITPVGTQQVLTRFNLPLTGFMQGVAVTLSFIRNIDDSSLQNIRLKSATVME